MPVLRWSRCRDTRVVWCVRAGSRSAAVTRCGRVWQWCVEDGAAAPLDYGEARRWREAVASAEDSVLAGLSGHQRMAAIRRSHRTRAAPVVVRVSISVT